MKLTRYPITNIPMSKKYFYPKRKALLSIQFQRDRRGVLKMITTVNEGSLKHDLFDMRNFGIKLSESELLDEDDKRALFAFFHSYNKHMLARGQKIKDSLYMAVC